MRIALPALALALVPLAACSKSEAPAASGPKVLKVAMIPKGTVHEFWKSVEKGAKRADAELADLEIVWKGPAGEGDAVAQIATLETFLAERYDGVLLSPLDAKALIKPVKAAVAGGTPVVLFDSGLAVDEPSVTSFVATDNYQGGQLAAAEMVRRLQGKGKVAVVRYLVGSDSTEQREVAFLDEMKKQPGIQVLVSDKYVGADESKAVEISESILATFGEQLDGVFCSAEPCTSGFLTALERDPRKLGDKLFVIGFDSGTKINKALESGLLDATVLQDPVGIGYESVKIMRKVLAGEPVDRRIRTRQVLATTQNMQTPEIHALLFPLEAR